MQSNYREIKNNLVQCPFNPSHKVKKCRLITHKKICPDRKNKALVQCPYNPNHQVTIENFDKHKAKCPNKVIINSDLEKEMAEFIKNKNVEKDTTNSNIKIEKGPEKENIQNNSNEIEGLNQKKIKNKNKKNQGKKGKKQEEKEREKESETNKELFNLIFNDNMVIEYHSDSSENNDDNENCERNSLDKNEDEKSED